MAMSYEEAYREYLEALHAQTRIAEELTPLMLSFVYTPGQPFEPPSDEMFERAGRLMKEERAAIERFLAAREAWFEAARRQRG
jgi:hypothetical protein